jgi:Fic family protein
VTSFYGLGERLTPVPSDVVVQLGQIHHHAGAAELYRHQFPGLLTQLRRGARVESAEASSAIEGIVIPRARAEAVVNRPSEQPRNRSEEEVRGYANALTFLFDRTEADRWPTVGLILHLHRLLYEPTGVHGAGIFKTADNEVIDRTEAGRVVRFRPVSAVATPAAVKDLVDAYQATVEGGRCDSLLAVGAFVLDLLVIHPFADGNGRISRLLTNYLLDHEGYDIGRYVSLESLTRDAEGRYYDALLASTHGWHDNEHDAWPWLRFFLEILVSAYRRFSRRADEERGHGTRSQRVRIHVLEQAPAEFSLADVARHLHVSEQTVRGVLQTLRDEGLVQAGQGRGAKWRRIGST